MLSLRANALFWISIARASFAVILGVAILATPGRSPSLITNFAAVFWLVSGVLNLRDIRAGRARRRLLGNIGGWTGIGVGIAVLTYSLVLRGEEGAHLVRIALGVVIFLTGALHLLGSVESLDAIALRVRPGRVLGVIEILLGIILVASPAREVPGLLGAWAFAAAFTLAAQAYYTRPHHEPKLPASDGSN
jgi:uncharacterized membrane protein HdeD (DUF308 family)